MILKGNERGHGAELARHLLNTRDNDHVSLHLIEGFVADDLSGALAETEAISLGTRCHNYLFSLSLNPPSDANPSIEVFEAAIAAIEEKLGLSGQPRAIVFHEKNGRRHGHCVWSRINPQTMRAIPLPHSKRKLMEIAQSLYLQHGWKLPLGFVDPDLSNSLAYSHAETGQATREARDPKALKEMFQRCWQQSDSRSAFAAALQAEGYGLARGERRGFVAVDRAGKIWSLSRWCDVSPKELAARLGTPDNLPTVVEALRNMSVEPVPQHQNANIATDTHFETRRAALVQTQRQERDDLLAAQQKRQIAELRRRQTELPHGIAGIWARVTGNYARLVAKLEVEARSSLQRDRQELQVLVERHLGERRVLERSRFASDIVRELHATFAASARSDPRQRLLLQAEKLPFTRDELIRDPALILTHLSHRQARFSEIEIKRALAVQIDAPVALRRAIDAALKASELVPLPEGSFTTRDFRKAEAQLQCDSAAMALQGGFAVSAGHGDAAMRTQDGQLQDRYGSGLSMEQRAAIHHLLGDRQFASVVGLAGSGKSTMLATARDAWIRAGRKVHGAALSGKAADELQASSGIESRTLASLELSWRNGYAPIAAGDILVVDEAGMVGTRQLMRVTQKLREIGAKLVLVGDPDQLQPIEAGTPFRQLVDDLGAARLGEIHRQKSAWQRHASLDLAEGRIEAAIAAYDADGSVSRSKGRDEALIGLVETYLAEKQSGGPDVTRLAFAHRRRDVFALNQAIREGLRRGEEAKPEVILHTETGPRAFAADDRIVFTRNDRQLGVKNGQLGTVEEVELGELLVRLDGEDGHIRRVRFNPDTYNSFDHGYAVTIHKSQGATVDQAYLLSSRTMDMPLTYVAMTRHREHLRMFICSDDAPSWAAQDNDIQDLVQERSRNWTRGPSMG